MNYAGLAAGPTGPRSWKCTNMMVKVTFAASVREAGSQMARLENVRRADSHKKSPTEAHQTAYAIGRLRVSVGSSSIGHVRVD